MLNSTEHIETFVNLIEWPEYQVIGRNVYIGVFSSIWRNARTFVVWRIDIGVICVTKMKFLFKLIQTALDLKSTQKLNKSNYNDR